MEFVGADTPAGAAVFGFGFVVGECGGGHFGGGLLVLIGFVEFAERDYGFGFEEPLAEEVVLVAEVLCVDSVLLFAEGGFEVVAVADNSNAFGVFYSFYHALVCLGDLLLAQRARGTWAFFD